MTHQFKSVQPQRIEVLGIHTRVRGRNSPPASGVIPDHQRSSLNPCGLFSRFQPDIQPIDLDTGAFRTNPSKPKLEPQLSVMSTDSGILPRDLRDSSFMEDIIGELTSTGICHSDIISGETITEEAGTSLCAKDTAPATCKSACKRKASCSLPASSDNGSVDFDVSSPIPRFGTEPSHGGSIKRLKNNEASRKSRASRKKKNALKEEEIACLEEENLRLSLLLKDFNDVATTCKRWLVQKMENPAEA